MFLVFCLEWHAILVPEELALGDLDRGIHHEREGAEHRQAVKPELDVYRDVPPAGVADFGEILENDILGRLWVRQAWVRAHQCTLIRWVTSPNAMYERAPVPPMISTMATMQLLRTGLKGRVQIKVRVRNKGLGSGLGLAEHARGCGRA